MQTDELKLRSDAYYTQSSELIFFISNRIPLARDGMEELRRADFITVRSTYSRDDGRVYVFATEDYAYFAKRSEKDNLSVIKIIEGREYRAGKKEQYQQKAFVIQLKMKAGIVYDRKKYPLNRENRDWNMKPGSLDTLLDAIIEYFNSGGAKSDNEDTHRITRNLVTQVLQPIEDFTHYEDLVEQNAAYESLHIFYDRCEVLRSTAQSKIYNFYSSSFDPENESFQVGDRVAVESNEAISDERKLLVKGYIVDRVITEDNVLFQVEFRDQFDDFILEKTNGKIYPAVNEAQKNVRERVVSDIKYGKIASSYMYQFFYNYKTGGYREDPGWEAFRRKLESREHPPVDSQMEAIQKGIETRDIQLVLGPPGTGKTTVIVAWVEYFISQGKRVLISSQNNAAVDNVLERINDPNAKIIRVGRIQKIQDNCRQYALERQKDRAVQLYHERLDESCAGIDFNIAEIEKMLVNLDNSIAAYQELEQFETKMDKQKEIISSAAQYLLKCHEEAEKSFAQYAKIHARKIKAEKALYEYETEGGNVFVKAINSVRKKTTERRLNQMIPKECVAVEDYIELVNKYNDEAEHVQNLLNDPESLRLAEKAEFLERKCNDILQKLNHFRLRGNLQDPPPSISADERGDVARDKLTEYRDRLKEHEQRLEKIGIALNDWEKALDTQRNDIVLDLLIRQSNVVGATCIGINTERKFRNVQFDVSIIDECGQIQIHNVIVPMTRAPKTLMLGDHKQIPPMANEDLLKLCRDDGIQTELLEKSFFEFLFEKLEEKDSPNITRLDEQFRMPGVISDVISESFYDGHYTAVYDMSRWEPVIKGTNSPLVMISTSNYSRRFETGENSADPTPGYCNFLEADVVARIIKKLYADRSISDESQVGIISAYGKQVRLIRKMIDQVQVGLDQEQIYSMAASLDSFQGQERPLIIFSATRSSNYRKPNQKRIGFLKELRRLNVAFTRCKRQLVIIGDFDYLTSCEHEETDSETGKPLPNKSEKEFSEFMKKMVSQAKSKNGEYYELADFYKKVGI